MNKKLIYLIFALAIIGGILLGYRIILSPKLISLQVVLVSPENQAQNISTVSKIIIDFNRPIKNEQEVIINLNPSVKSTFTFNNNQKTIEIILQEPLHSSTVYNLEIKSQKNKLLWQSTFTTETLQGDPAIPYETESYTKNNYPLLKFIPYETEDFEIVYSTPLTLKVRIKKGSKETIEPIILNWIKSQGINPSTHRIEYLTPGPSPAL